MKFLIRKLFLLLAGILISSQTIAQCVMCKAQAEAQMEESGTGINTGIIYIMIIPYIILGFVFHKQIIAFFKNWKSLK